MCGIEACQHESLTNLLAGAAANSCFQLKLANRSNLFEKGMFLSAWFVLYNLNRTFKITESDKAVEHWK